MLVVLCVHASHYVLRVRVPFSPAPQVTTADFGEVLVGKSTEHVLRFGNHSMVPANFTIVPESQDHVTDHVYTIHPARCGCICCLILYCCAVLILRSYNRQCNVT